MFWGQSDAMTQPYVYFVDDDEGIRVSMQALLQLDGLPSKFYASGRELLDDIDAIDEGCLVVDFRMPEMSGLQLVREVRARGSDLPFLLISGCATISIAVEAMKLGAVNIIEKPFDPAEFLACVHATFEESKRMHKLASESDLEDDPRSLLTPREKQVLEMVVAGELTKNIAKSLGISTKTVEVHRSNITKKFRVDSVAQLVARVYSLDPQLVRTRSTVKSV